MNELIDKNRYVYNNFKIINKYKSAKDRILLEDEYGVLSVSADSLLHGSKPTIQSAVDKGNYFKNKVKIINHKLYNKIHFITHYKNHKTNIIIRDKYGLLSVRPDHLLDKTNLTIMSAVNQTDYFIEQSKQNNRHIYNYALTHYEGAKKNIKVICKKHGVFEIEASSHKMGRGCPHCSMERINSSSISNTDDFVLKAKNIHQDTYNYELVNYKNAIDKVIIICDIHGIFYQSPNGHLSGRGCQYCAYEENSKKQSNNTEYFIKKSKEVHGDKYKYDKVSYINNTTPVLIYCPIHGYYKQLPTSHMSGHGCRYCNQYYYSIKTAKKHKEEFKKIKTKVYVVRFYNDSEDFFKIGITKHKISKRFRKIKKYKLETIVCLKCSLYNAIYLETILHKNHKQYNYMPNYHFHGDTECFSMVDEWMFYKAFDELEKIINDS